MELSVVITAFDKHDVTVAHVRACLESSRVPDEIIVVNDHGHPSLREMLLELKHPIHYAYVLDDIPWNYTGARNLGYFISRGDFISSEDNDNIPSKQAYQEALDYMQNSVSHGRLLYGRRAKVYREDLAKPIDQWRTHGTRVRHQDTQMLRRETIIRMKGCDEQFAGRYAWQCADWRRRLMRAGVKTLEIDSPFYTVVDGETDTLVRSKSYKNYELARKKTHTQSPIGIVNFSYTHEVL